MSEACVLFNPRCSKCRQARDLLDERGVEVDYLLYLDEPLSRARLVELLAQLGETDPRAMMRTGEPIYKELDLADASADELLDAMAEHPILIERPIFVVGDRAVIGRPPERVYELLD